MIENKKSDKKNKVRRISIQISCVIIFSFMLLFSVICTNQSAEDMERFNSVGKSATARTSRALDTWISDQIRVVKTIAEDPRIIRVCRDPESEDSISGAQKYLDSMHDRYPYYENLPIAVFLDESVIRKVDGKEVLVENGTFLLDTVENKTLGKCGIGYSYISEISEGKDYYISEVYPSILRENPIFVVSAPVKYDGETIGVAIISPQIEHFTKKFITNFGIGDTGYLFLIDSRGQGIAHYKPEFMVNDDGDFLDEKERLFSRIIDGTEILEAEFQGITKHYYSMKSEIDSSHIEYSWYLVFTQNNEEIFKSTNNLLKGITPILLVLIAVMTVLVHFVTKINQQAIHEEYLKETNLVLENKVKERTLELERIANTDGLTKLFNQKAIQKKIEKSVSEAKAKDKKISIILADLDHFKKVNDNFGHQVGDEVLAVVAREMGAIVGEHGTTGRYGGEEFIAIINGGFEQGIAIANSVRKAIADLRFANPKLRVTVSLGVCEWRGETTAEFIKRVDGLLYKAKNNGRNRVEGEK